MIKTIHNRLICALYTNNGIYVNANIYICLAICVVCGVTPIAHFAVRRGYAASPKFVDC